MHTYDTIAMIGTSDQSCWLAEACQTPVWSLSGLFWSTVPRTVIAQIRRGGVAYTLQI